MLNRKLSNYIFYGIILIIVGLVFLGRSLTLGVLLDKIDALDKQNIALDKQISELEDIVQENKDSQSSHLYELYYKIPNVYSGSQLTYKTVAMLEALDITEDSNTQSEVYVKHNATTNSNPDIDVFADDYLIVEVEIIFNTVDPSVVVDLINEIYNSEQLFIIKSVDFPIPDDDNYVLVNIKFYAIYDDELEIEEES